MSFLDIAHKEGKHKKQADLLSHLTFSEPTTASHNAEISTFPDDDTIQTEQMAFLSS